jgi:PAS domain S-box-containing protein
MQMQDGQHLAPDIKRRRKVGSFANGTSVLLGSVGTDGKFKFLNSAWEKTLGFRREELRSLPLSELVPPEVVDAVNVVKRFLEAVCGDPMEFGLRCKDGTRKKFLWHRRYDAEMQRMFIVGEEIGEGRKEPG